MGLSREQGSRGPSPVDSAGAACIAVPSEKAGNVPILARYLPGRSQWASLKPPIPAQLRRPPHVPLSPKRNDLESSPEQRRLALEQVVSGRATAIAKLKDRSEKLSELQAAEEAYRRLSNKLLGCKFEDLDAAERRHLVADQTRRKFEHRFPQSHLDDDPVSRTATVRAECISVSGKQGRPALGTQASIPSGALPQSGSQVAPGSQRIFAASHHSRELAVIL
ncbi:hypothetical protein B0H19DRAFT_1084613 [Mycena capillaripes]|nr:hypothetical protein B0H19DRAFT_1084613 [Mycena capillaripes]